MRIEGQPFAFQRTVHIRTNHGVGVKAGVDVGVLTLMLFPVRLLRRFDERRSLFLENCWCPALKSLDGGGVLVIDPTISGISATDLKDFSDDRTVPCTFLIIFRVSSIPFRSHSARFSLA